MAKEQRQKRSGRNVHFSYSSRKKATLAQPSSDWPPFVPGLRMTRVAADSKEAKAVPKGCKLFKFEFTPNYEVRKHRACTGH